MKTMAQSKIPLAALLDAFDKNDKKVFDDIPKENHKDIGFWLLNRYMSVVQGSTAAQENAVLKVNEIYNKNWNSLGARHPKLQWQLLCVCGNTGKAERHQWISFSKSNLSKEAKLLLQIYPHLKDDEAETLARISTKKELRELAKEHGIDNVKL